MPEFKAAAVQYTVTIEVADSLPENDVLFANAAPTIVLLVWLVGRACSLSQLERTLDACVRKPLVGSNT